MGFAAPTNSGAPVKELHFVDERDWDEQEVQNESFQQSMEQARIRGFWGAQTGGRQAQRLLFAYSVLSVPTLKDGSKESEKGAETKR